ncbi:MAG: hypothetical protein KGQ59_09415 [Bdellovibrionales bacterium]|nr:hypothetical protein [Bdellovibrionales bacterium]
MDSIVRANQWEDQNLLRKWARYSHFYNPEREFASLRLTSKDRIISLETKIKSRGPGPAPKKYIGEALHHVQDMSTPTHVIPVNHLWTDGFESLPTRTETQFDFGSCNDLIGQAARMSIVEIHQETAEVTLRRVMNESLRALAIGKPKTRSFKLPLLAFWNFGGEGQWGSYGIIGNAFGQELVHTDAGSIFIRNEEYLAFKQRQLQLALRASQLVLTKLYILGI